MTDADTEELKTHLYEYAEQNLERSKGEQYVCPFCLSGTGVNKTGAFSINKNSPTQWKCFSCGKFGDIFDLIEELEGITDFKGKKDRARELFPLSGNHIFVEAVEKVEQEQKTPLFLDYLQERAEHIEETDYWKKRGLSLETVKRYGIGYDPEWINPKSARAYPTPRLIIPTSDTSYVARRTDGKDERGKVMKAGAIHFFPLSVLSEESVEPIFVVEGEIDALSFAEIGKRAIAIGTAEQVGAFLDYIKDKPINAPFVVALDTDGTGIKAGAKLFKGLKEQGKTAFRYNIYGNYKDANEALVNDRTAFQERADKEPEETELREEAEEYIKKSDAFYLEEFQKETERKTPRISTGFITLDEALGSSGYINEIGGLYEGLYVLGGLSSVGKTTFCLQMIDQIAKAGHSCLIFSLEMSRYELTAKALSRITMEIAREAGKEVIYAQTVRGITDPERRRRYNEIQKNLYEGAIERRLSYAGNIYTHEGTGNIGVEKVRKEVEKHVKITGQTPVILVDYLQILAPYNERATDKQNTDKAVIELKRISRDFSTPVIAISSFNRANYNTGVSMEAFKESGAIEYSSDVLIGLQLAGTGAGVDLSKARREDPRKIELVILKNRNGMTGEKRALEYYPRFNWFDERGVPKDWDSVIMEQGDVSTPKKKKKKQESGE